MGYDISQLYRLKLKPMNCFFYPFMGAFIVLITIGCAESIPVNISSENVRTKSSQASQEQPSPKNIIYTTVQWTDLLPDDDLKALENPPEYLDDIEDGSESDRLVNSLKAVESGSPSSNNQNGVNDDRYQQALTSIQVRPEFSDRDIRIPGFIVPLEFGEGELVTTFFFVPFFGACLHMPPPPPNQIIFAQYSPGIRLQAFYDAFWITGKLSTTLTENDVATAAYSIQVTSIDPYHQDGAQQWGEAEPL